jgi:hypothetical protein
MEETVGAAALPTSSEQYCRDRSSLERFDRIKHIGFLSRGLQYTKGEGSRLCENIYCQGADLHKALDGVLLMHV